MRCLIVFLAAFGVFQIIGWLVMAFIYGDIHWFKPQEFKEFQRAATLIWWTGCAGFIGSALSDNEND